MSVLTVLTLLKVKPSPLGNLHGERPFWAAYGERYLRAWLAGVRRYVPDPKRIVVMTDTIRTDSFWTAPVDINYRFLDSGIDAPGFWAKLNMFREGVSEGRTLYMDLDTVLTGDLSALCALPADPLVMLDDRHVPGLPNGSVMLFDAERCRHLWEVYAADPRRYEAYYVARDDDYWLAYDQAFVAMHGMRYGTKPYRDVPFFQNLLSDGYCLNAYSELPKSEDWRSAHLIFGCGGGKEGKPHTASHQVFRNNWASV